MYRILLILVTVFIVTSWGYTQWSTNGVQNNPVCTAPLNQLGLKTIPDGNGGIILNSPGNGNIVSGFSLKQNYPNPFNPATVISYNIPSRSFVSLKIFDVSGKLITDLVNKLQDAGSYEVNFSAENYGLSSGIYFYKFETGEYSSAKSMILIK